MTIRHFVLDLTGALLASALLALNISTSHVPKYFQIQPKIISVENTAGDIAIPMSKDMWKYLRGGLNYVEASGRNYPPYFLHPGGKAYGALALTPIAIEDVIRRYKALSHYTVNDVLSRPDIYEECAALYADLLLSHYLKLKYQDMPKEKIFEILQRAWFLGPGLYQKGLPIPTSRQIHAEEYVKNA